MIYLVLFLIFVMIVILSKSSTKNEHDYVACFGDDSKYLSYFNKGFAIGPRAFPQKTISHSHMYVAGPSGSGKSTIVAMPTIAALARGRSSMIINDVSGELANSGQYLADKGYTVFHINFTKASVSESFNPLLTCKSVSDIQKVALMVVRNSLGESKSDPFWEQSAINLIGIFIRYLVFYAPVNQRTLQNTLLLIERFSIDGASVDKLFAATGDVELLSQYKAFLVTGEKTLASIIATARTALFIFSDPEIAKTTGSSSLDFSILRQKPVAIFLNNPLQDLEYVKPIVAIFIQSLFNFVMEKIPSKNDKHDVFFVIDEFATYTFPNIDVTISNMRKYAGMCIIMQDDAALSARYGPYVASQIVTNCGIRCYLKGSPQRVCNQISQALGQYTFVDEHGNKKTRPLMTPDEVRMTESCIVFVNNQQPLSFIPTPFYKSFWLRRLARSKPCHIPEKVTEPPVRISF